MNGTYCYEKRTIGKQAAKEILAESESVSDAAIDFHYFIEKCYKNCPYKDVRKGVDDDNF